MGGNTEDNSAQSFEGFFAIIPDLAAVISPDGRLKRVNPAWGQMLGYSDEELLGAPISGFIHPEDLKSFPGELAHAFSRTATTCLVNRCRCKDNSWKWIEWKAAPAPDHSFVFATGRDITAKKRNLQKLEEQDRQLSTIYSSVSDALFLLAVESEDRYRFLTVNRTFFQLTGLDKSQVLGKYLDEVLPASSLPKVLGYYRDAINGKSDVNWEEASDFPAGQRFGDVVISPIFDENGRCTNVVGRVRDLTEQRQSVLDKAKLEEQLRQAQKLESVGRLAGGVAHDFNNILTVIQGYTELLKNSLGPADSLREYAVHIGKAGERAVSLTRQLLAFSRKQEIKLQALDLNGVVSETKSMLQSLIGEDIVLVTRLRPNLGQVLADPDQIHQVLMNLVANARDAMPEGGKLIIETTEIRIDDNYVRTHPEATKGRCVLMSVQDFGSGIDEKIRPNLFEPFFTTKGPGEGTGLGLATVYGIVHQFKGWIDVDSRTGHGATFLIYLPCIRNNSAVQPDSPFRATAQSGSETILLVEDEDAVRNLAATILSSYGYSVITASSGPEAMDVVSNYTGNIHLILTDVVMPGMNGRELADRLKATHRDLKVLFMSGYAPEFIDNRGITSYESAFLPKPFSQAVLASKVHEVLNGTAASRPAPERNFSRAAN